MNTELIALIERDLDFVRDMFNYYILNTTYTFYTSEVSTDYLKSVIPIADKKYRSFLIKYNGEACGYCYFSRYNRRQAYDRTAEVTIYLKPGFSGKGIGKFALMELENVAKRNNICVLVAMISGENKFSISLFEKCGYERCAHFRCIGEKFNRIIDDFAYQKIIE